MMKKESIRIGLIIALYVCFVQAAITRETGSFKDPRDGKEYKTIHIGSQNWFAENLSYNMPDDSSGDEYDATHVLKFGRMYMWESALKACPAGWHLPSKEEFEFLLETVGGAGQNAFNQLISGGNSRFSVLVGGWRNNGGADGNTGNYAYFWSSTKDRPGRVWTLNVYGYGKSAIMFSSYLEYAYSNTHGKYTGFSVRCIQDN